MGGLISISHPQHGTVTELQVIRTFPTSQPRKPGPPVHRKTHRSMTHPGSIPWLLLVSCEPSRPCPQTLRDDRLSHRRLLLLHSKKPFKPLMLSSGHVCGLMPLFPAAVARQSTYEDPLSPELADEGAVQEVQIRRDRSRARLSVAACQKTQKFSQLIWLFMHKPNHGDLFH